MPEFLTTLLSFPTVVFSGLMVIVLLYWATVIFGAIDLDFLDSFLGLDAMESALDGAIDAIDGAADGAADGVLDGAEGAADSAEAGEPSDGAKAGAFAGLMNTLGVRGIPVTIFGSFVLLWAWVLSFSATKILGSLAASVVVGLFLAGASLFGALLLGALSARPFRKLFAKEQARVRASLVGRMCTVSSARVDGSTGRAEIEDGGSGFVAEVRCPQNNDLKRGSRALVYRYEPAEGIFFIGPVDAVLTEAEKLKGGET